MRLLRHASVTTKLSALTALAISVAMSLCCAAFIYNDLHTLQTAKRQRVESLALVLGANTVSAIEFDDRESAFETLSSLANEPSIEFAALYDAEGKLFATYPRDTAHSVPQLATSSSPEHDPVDGRSMEVVRPVFPVNVNPLPAPTPGLVEAGLHGGELPVREASASQHPMTVGTILIRANTADIREQITTRTLAAGAVFAVSLAVGLVISRLFQRSITAPVYELVKAARHIARHNDYSYRSTKFGDDELGVLCDAFNSMLSQLQSGRAQLQQAHDELEQRVIERTAKLEKAMRAANAANKAKSDFLANMSHEIRTPMTAILGYADLLSEDEIRPEDKAERIETIQRNARHLLELINEILDVSKMEAGKMSVERIPCSLGELLADVDSLLRCRATDKGLKLEVEYQGQLPEMIHTDPMRLRQILVNLVGNAVKFTECGSIKLLVSYVRSAPGKSAQLQFDVIDTGIGLAHNQLTCIFQPFTQADESMTRRFGGTGLGLPISQGLARLLGGDVVVESQLGVGSRFTLTIEPGDVSAGPWVSSYRDSARRPVPARAPSPQPPVGESAPLPTLDGRILLVEDGLDNQRLLSFLLRKAGAEVALAENGQIGLDIALDAWREGRPFDLVLMDMQMPVLDGYLATAQLRAANYPFPIVALTAHAMSDERERCLHHGCNDYLSKPVDRAKLLASAARWIEHGRELRGPQS